MSPWRRAGIPAAAVLLIVAVVLAIVGGEGGSAPAATEAPPRIVRPEDLAAAEDSLGHRLYWAGDPGQDRLELKEAGGNVYLRYLPPGAPVGSRPAAYLTIGTYPVANAPAALRRTAKAAGSRLQRLADGAVVFDDPSSPGSAYLAYPGDLEIEVYDPAPGKAMELIRAGAIEPVGE